MTGQSWPLNPIANLLCQGPHSGNVKAEHRVKTPDGKSRLLCADCAKDERTAKA